MTAVNTIQHRLKSKHQLVTKHTVYITEVKKQNGFDR